jgi:natural product biosynthesis luciferase-like monooxygenase protein
VDNLSEGRVDLSFARGWNPNDFVVAPGDYADRTQRLFDGIDIVRRLWRGEALHVPNGVGEPTEVRIFPMPRQAELEVWLTCSGGAQRFVEAGQLGFNVLTNLILQPLDELSAKIRLYREARETAGHAGPGKVTVMLHTLLGADEGRVREAVEAPFRAYLESSVDLWGGTDRRLSEMSEAERAEVLGYAFERYYRTCALFGTPQSCLPLVRRLGAADVDELACLIDFGAPDADVVHGVRHMRDLQDLANAAPPPVDDLSSDGKTELLRRLLRRRSEAEGRL